MTDRTLAKFLLAFALAPCGCAKGSEDPATSDAGASGMKSFCELPAPCREISEACMPKDDGEEGPVHRCHEIGMSDGIEAACARELDGCLSTCAAAPALEGAPVDLAAACGDAGGPGDGGAGDASRVEGGAASSKFPAAALSVFESEAGTFRLELRTAPDQPVRVGVRSEGELRIEDVATGTAPEGLTVRVETYMPEMRHPCTAGDVQAVELGAGVFRLRPILAIMPGQCQLKLVFSGGASDRATSPAFEIAE